MRKTFLLGISLILISSFCLSQESKIQNYICLNASQSKLLMDAEKYELKIPDNWCSYNGFHNILMYSPKSLLNLKDNFYKNNLYVAAYDNSTYKSENIEEAIKKHYVLLNDNSQFAPVLEESIHEIYGKYYIIKRKSIQHGEKIMNLDLLFNYKNQDYIIYYSVLEKDFNANLNDVIQIMESFKILE